jgi:hypothetical protein
MYTLIPVKHGSVNLGPIPKKNSREHRPGLRAALSHWLTSVTFGSSLPLSSIITPLFHQLRPQTTMATRTFPACSFSPPWLLSLLTTIIQDGRVDESCCNGRTFAALFFTVLMSRMKMYATT